MFVPRNVFGVRSPLVYPAGRAPGFDPSHPVAQGGAIFSGVAQNGAFIRLDSAPVAFTRTGTPVAVNDGVLGPCFQPATTNNGSTGGINFAIPMVAGAKALGIVFRPNTYAGSTASVLLAAGSATNNAIAQTSSGALQLTVTGSAVVTTTMIPPIGVPHFLAVSTWLTGYAILLMNLLTGGITTQTGSTNTQWSANTIIYIGNNTAGSRGSPANIASVAIVNGLLNLSQLYAWAADFQSFWYPQNAFEKIFLTGVVVGNNYNLPTTTGTYALTGNAQTLATRRYITATTVSYVVSGNPQSFAVKLSLSASVGSYSLSGQPAALIYTPAGGAAAAPPHALKFHADVGAMMAR